MPFSFKICIGWLIFHKWVRPTEAEKPIFRVIRINADVNGTGCRNDESHKAGAEHDRPSEGKSNRKPYQRNEGNGLRYGKFSAKRFQFHVANIQIKSDINE